MKPIRSSPPTARARVLRLGLLAVTAFVLAETAGAEETAAVEIEAAALYHDYCSVCHGDKGDANSRARGSLNPPPRDFTTPRAAIELTRERMIHAVAEGRPGTAMTAWKHQLDEAQIAAIVDYIRTTMMVPTLTAEAQETGRRIFGEYCSVCHGELGNGRSRASGSLMPPPRDFTAAGVWNELDRDRMIFSVSYGRPNTAMAGWDTQLSRAEIEAVVDYVRTAFMGIQHRADGSEILPEDPNQTAGTHKHVGAIDDLETYLLAGFDYGLMGDPVWGKTFYNDNCSSCHGVNGDGEGPRSYFILPRPRDFRHEAVKRSLNRPHLFKSIARGTLRSEMPAWDTVLTAQEIANVAEYVFRTFIYPEGAHLQPVYDPNQHAHQH